MHPVKGTHSPRARRIKPAYHRYVATVVISLAAFSALWIARRPSLKEPPPSPVFPDMVVDDYLTRLLRSVTTSDTATWHTMQDTLRGAVLRDARACMADPLDAAWNHTNDDHNTIAAPLALMWDELRTLVLSEAPGLCTAPMLHPWATRARPHYMFAANLRDAQHLAPHLIRQLVIAVAVLQPHAVVSVSIYESGSRDATGLWLQVLHIFLELMAVPNRIVVDPHTGAREGRIQFLAKLRNRLLDPLDGTTSDPPLPKLANGSASRLWDDTNHRPRLPSSTALDARHYAIPTRIVFFNDAYVCAWHVLRLLSHDADMVCGLDFWRSLLRKPSLDSQAPARVPPVGNNPHAAAMADIRRQGVLRRARGQPFAVYDIWVARDSEGRRFGETAPYVRTGNAYVQQRAAAGSAFPVSCCWNGIVVVDAAPFLSGLRFRAHRDGECSASECSLLCRDLLGAGFTRIAMDPAVRSAYLMQEAEDLYTPYVGQFGGLNGTSVVVPVSPVDWSRVLLPPKRWECCPLGKGDDFIDVRRCRWETP